MTNHMDKPDMDKIRQKLQEGKIVQTGIRYIGKDHHFTLAPVNPSGDGDDDDGDLKVRVIQGWQNAYDLDAGDPVSFNRVRADMETSLDGSKDAESRRKAFWRTFSPKNPEYDKRLDKEKVWAAWRKNEPGKLTPTNFGDPVKLVPDTAEDDDDDGDSGRAEAARETSFLDACRRRFRGGNRKKRQAVGGGVSDVCNRLYQQQRAR